MRIDDLRRVLIVGAGRMGTEIALQCAIGGYDVVLQDVSAAQLETAARWQRQHLDEFLQQGRLTPAEANAVQSRIVASLDPAAAAEVDLVNESIPENLKLKRELFARLHAVCKPETIFTSNTSYLRPPQLAGHVGRPEQFALMHFHPPVWRSNVVDIMPHEGTAPEVVELLRQFSGRIGQIPIVCKNQGEGYIFNTMLRTWLLTAISIADSGVSDIEDIDRSWMGVMLTKVGPFGILDNIGLDTVSDILKFWGMILRDPQARKATAFLKPYVEAGHLGIKTNKGFYDYPDPGYLHPEFLTAAMSESTAADSLIRRFMEHERKTPQPATRTASGGETPPTPDTLSEGPQRYVLRALPTPVHQKLKHPLRFAGPCLIVGENADSEALARRLGDADAEVRVLSAAGTTEEFQARLDAAWQEALYSHLFLMTARDPAAASDSASRHWDVRSSAGVLHPFLACQRWYAEIMKRGLFETASVVGVTAMGGDFGIGGGVESMESGGIAGLLKAVYLEGAVRSSLGPQVKVIDLPTGQSPETTAEQICREGALAQASVVTGSRDESRRRYAELEVGYARGIRHQVFLEPQSAGENETPEEWSLTPGSVWVVTGGARGITAFVARELGARHRLRLHLLGTTPLPSQPYEELSAEALQTLEGSIRQTANAGNSDPDAAWKRFLKGRELQRTLKEFADAGVTARYHVCDVTQRDALASVLETIRREDGPIAGVLHGAGLEIGAKIPDKKLADVRATLAVKADGMAWLMELTQHDPLQWFIAFGSLSGRFGNYAQADYSMANELLAKQLVWLRSQRPDCRCAVFHWPGWSELGMAARPEGKEGLRRGHHTFLSPEQGLRHLLREMARETPAGEVVIIHRNEIPLEMRLAAATGGKRAPTWQRD